jgi:hypothetical protein
MTIRWSLLASVVCLGLLAAGLFFMSPTYLARAPQVVIFWALLVAVSAWALWSAWRLGRG